MAFHRTAVLKRRFHSEHLLNREACNPGTGGRHIDPDLEVSADRIPNDEPIQFVGQRTNAKRKRSPSPVLHSNASPKRKFEHPSSTQSSACCTGVGGHLTDPHQTGITDKAFDTELFSEIAESFGFSKFMINSLCEPLPQTDLAVPSQLASVSHVRGEPTGCHLHSYLT